MGSQACKHVKQIKTDDLSLDGSVMWANKIVIVYATLGRVFFFYYLQDKESYSYRIFLRRTVNQILDIWYNKGSSSGVAVAGKI